MWWGGGYGGGGYGPGYGYDGYGYGFYGSQVWVQFFGRIFLQKCAFSCDIILCQKINLKTLKYASNYTMLKMDVRNGFLVKKFFWHKY